MKSYLIVKKVDKINKVDIGLTKVDKKPCQLPIHKYTRINKKKKEPHRKKRMKTNKVINLEEAIRKRETPLIREYSCNEDWEKINKIFNRRLWREKRQVQ